MPNPQLKFSPIADVGNSVLLPGMQYDMVPGQALVPPDLKPIPASGDMTGTIFPLADPVPVPLPPEPIELAMAPMSEDAMAQGLPLVDLPPLDAPEFPEVPPPVGEGGPGMDPLGEPLPTAVPDAQRPWPPYLTPLEPVQNPPPAAPEPVRFAPVEPPEQTVELPSPEEVGAPPERPPLAFEAVDSIAARPAEVAGPAALPGLDLADAPALAELPAVLVEMPAGVEAPAVGEPLTGAVESGLDALTAALADIVGPHDARAKAFMDERGRLRAPVPPAADGKVIWEQVWGDA